MLTDLRVLIVRMMQAPRDDRLDSPFRICFRGLLTYLLTHLLPTSCRAAGSWSITQRARLSGKRRGAGSINDAQTNGMLLEQRAPPAHTSA